MKKKFMGVFILAAIVVGVIVFYGVRYIRTPVDTQIAKISIHENKFSANAYLVRTENVYTAPNTGTFYSSETEGSRVGKARAIASVYNGNVDMGKLLELNNLDKKIASAEAYKRSSSWFSSEDSADENQIETKKNNIIEAVENNDIAKISTYKTELQALVSGKKADSDNGLNELKQQKTKLEAGIGATKRDIKTGISGIYTTNVDGLENVLTPESVLSYTPADFDALIKPQKKETPVQVNSGEPVCKVVDNHVWYAMIKVEADKLKDCDVKTKVQLRFDSAPSVLSDAKLIYKSEEDNGFIVAVFQSEHYVEGIFTVRNSDMDIILDSYTGYVVPVSAVRVVEGQTGVMIETRGTEVFCACDVLYTNSNEGYAVVYPTQEAKRKLENGDKIVLGEKIKGGGGT